MNKESARQCIAMTQKNVRCKRQTLDASQKCYQHQTTTKIKTLFSKKSNLLAKHLKRGPDKKDVSGFVYLYFLEKDNVANLYKLGKTQRGLQDRLKEWSKKHLPLKLKFVSAFYFGNVKFAERAFHLYFDSLRVYRYREANQKEYINVWKETGTILNTKESSKYSPPHGTTKHTEWFCGQLEVLKSGFHFLIPLIYEIEEATLQKA